MSQENTERILYVDVLRVLSVFLVVVLHVVAPLVANLYTNGESWWWIGNIIDSFTRWSVPILIMVSGILLLNSKKEQALSVFLKRRIGKIIIPLIFWSFAYMLWTNRADLSIDAYIIKAFILRFYNGEVHIHLWYLYMVVGLYLITPVLKEWIKKTTVTNIKYFIIIWFIVNGIINFTQKFTGHQTGFVLDFFHWSIGYYILGVLINKLELKEYARRKAYVIGIIGYIGTVMGTYITTRNNGGEYVPHFYSFYSPTVIPMVIGVYVLFKSINWESIIRKDSLLYKVILELSNASFGIYLIHLLVLDILSSRHMIVKLSATTIHPIIGVLVTSVVGYIVSYLSVKILSMIPIIKKVVPR